MDNVIQNISIENIIPSRFPPNQEELQKIDELIQIIKTLGLLDPLLVRPKDGKYEIVMGIDKYEAAKAAGLNNIPVIIKDIDDKTFYQYIKMTNHTLSSEKKEKNEKTQNNNFNNNYTIPLEGQSNDDIELTKWVNSNEKEHSDVVNLSELNKTEYERDDYKMNNEQLNNTIMNNQMGTNTIQNMGVEEKQSPQVPTFGGRFFPSLEDEPTNMNMMESAPVPPITTDIPAINNQMSNNNLIDLTDLSNDKVPTMPDLEASVQGQPQMTLPTNNIVNLENLQTTNGLVQPTSEITPTISDLEMPVQGQPQMIPPTDNIVNLENLQVNNPAVQPVASEASVPPMNSPINPIENNFQSVPETNSNTIPSFGTSVQEQPQMALPTDNIISLENLQANNSVAESSVEIPSINTDFNQQIPVQPQFDMSQNVSPTISNEATPTVPNTIPDLGMPIQEQSMVGVPSILEQSNPIPSPETISTINQEKTPIAPITQQEQPQQTLKDVSPVINTIKNLITNLESFGYKINISEEDLNTSTKVVIEVEK